MPTMTSEKSKQTGVDLTNRLFDILRERDREAYNQFVDPDMRGFEAGKVFNRETFFQILVDAHAEGTRIKWSVTDARPEVSEDVAVVSYINKGSVQKKNEEELAVSWLETVVFVKRGEDWKVVHVSSMRTV